MEKLTNIQGIPTKCIECKDSKSCDYWCNAYDECAKKLREYEELELTPEQIREMDRIYSEQAKELAQYKNAEKEGLLLKLPCKRGDIVYAKMKTGEYEKVEVRDYIHFSPYGFCIIVVSEKYEKRTIPFSEFGKTVFLAKPETKVESNIIDKT